MPSIQKTCVVVLIAAAAIVSGCGSSSSSTSSSASGGSAQAGSGSATSAAKGSSTGGGSATGPGALSAEAKTLATGDIPDNQMFLVFHNGSGGYSIKYPEGWTQQGTGANVTFKDKNNLVHIVLGRGRVPSVASVTGQLNALKHRTPTLAFTAPHGIQVSGAPAIKVSYTTQSPPNPVTGKRVILIVDRYELAHSGRVAVVDLGTAKGVDNIDAYRKMIQSYAWR